MNDRQGRGLHKGFQWQRSEHAVPRVTDSVRPERFGDPGKPLGGRQVGAQPNHQLRRPTHLLRRIRNKLFGFILKAPRDNRGCILQNRIRSTSKINEFCCPLKTAPRTPVSDARQARRRKTRGLSFRLAGGADPECRVSTFGRFPLMIVRAAPTHRRALVVRHWWGFPRPPKLLRTFSEEFLKKSKASGSRRRMCSAAGHAGGTNPATQVGAGAGHAIHET